MNSQTISELDEIIRLNPTDAKVYINRGYAYNKKGNSTRVIEDYDSAVRLCSNYETDFINSRSEHRGQEEIKAGLELLDSMIGSPRESAADFYYTGVKALFNNDQLSARRGFKIALELGYEDRAKVKRHLENLNNRK